MKFIRDIINEKKLAGAVEAARYEPAPDPEPEAVLDLDAAAAEEAVEPAPEADEDLVNLFSDTDVAGEDEMLFGEADEPAFCDQDAEEYSESVLHPPAEMSEAAEDAPAAVEPELPAGLLDETLTQHLMARRPGAQVEPEMSVDLGDAVEVPAPAAGRGSRRAGRVKTRLLGFGAAKDGMSDPINSATPTNPNGTGQWPAGWLVVAEGPGQGAVFTLVDGVAQIGRGEDQAIRLDFGDTSISRSNHAAVAYDPEQKEFFLGHGGKANLVRLNGQPVLSTECLKTSDQIRIGETVLRFVSLCGPDFDWAQAKEDGSPCASYA